MADAVQVRVWDPLVRVFHWSLVATTALAVLTQEEAYEPHLSAGYAVLGLVLVRVAWGLVGPRHARFADFLYGPAATLGYLRALRAGRAPRYLGHNPAGGWMVMLLLLTLLVASVSGVALDAAENRAGPLGGLRLFLYLDPILAVHELATDVLLALVAAHLLGVAHASLAHRENLVRAMLTGRKRAG